MLRNDSVLWYIVALLAGGCVVAMVLHFTSEGRLRKRRRKSHTRVVSSARQPTVKFSVKVPPDKKE
jgi:hypothetical protein